MWASRRCHFAAALNVWFQCRYGGASFVSGITLRLKLSEFSDGGPEGYLGYRSRRVPIRRMLRGARSLNEKVTFSKQRYKVLNRKHQPRTEIWANPPGIRPGRLATPGWGAILLISRSLYTHKHIYIYIYINYIKYILYILSYFIYIHIYLVFIC